MGLHGPRFEIASRWGACHASGQFQTPSRRCRYVVLGPHGIVEWQSGDNRRLAVEVPSGGSVTVQDEWHGAGHQVSVIAPELKPGEPGPGVSRFRRMETPDFQLMICSELPRGSWSDGQGWDPPPRREGSRYELPQASPHLQRPPPLANRLATWRPPFSERLASPPASSVGCSTSRPLARCKLQRARHRRWRTCLRSSSRRSSRCSLAMRGCWSEWGWGVVEGPVVAPTSSTSGFDQALGGSCCVGAALTFLLSPHPRTHAHTSSPTALLQLPLQEKGLPTDGRKLELLERLEKAA